MITGILSSIINSMLIRFYSNKEITFECGDSIKPMFTSVCSSIYQTTASYKLNDLVFISNSKDTASVDMPEHIKPCSVVFINDMIDNLKLTDKSCLYVFIYKKQNEYNNVLKFYKKYLLNQEYLSILMPEVFLKLMVIHLMKSGESIKISFVNIEGYFHRLTFFALILAMLLALNKYCKSMIDHISKLDPVFTDFNIVYSNILKFKDLNKRDIPECTICYEEFLFDSDVRLLECKHYFHPQCIDRWLIGHSKRCPCCRNNVEINEIV